MPREYYQMPLVENVRDMLPELNRILDSISRRLNFIAEDGDNISVSGKQIRDASNATLDSDLPRYDQVFGGGVGGVVQYALVVGNAAGGLDSLLAATNGQIPIGSTGADPVIANITGGTGITITNGSGSITITANSTVATKRITNADSPYTALVTDNNIFCDTDGGAITVNLHAGSAGSSKRIINTGSSGNNVTLNPNGTELLRGANSGLTIADSGILMIVYETTEGWW